MSVVPEIVNPAPEPKIGPLRKWLVSWPDGTSETVEAHFSQIDDGEDLVFRKVYRHDWVLNQVIPYGRWYPKTTVVFRARGYRFVKEITDVEQ